MKSRKSTASRHSVASSAVKSSAVKASAVKASVVSSAVKSSANKRIASSAVKSSASKPLTLSSALKASSALKRSTRQSYSRPKSPVQKINYSDLDKENEIHLVQNPFQTKAKLEHTPVKCANKVVITASEANTPNSTDQTVLMASSKKGTPLENTITLDTTWKLEEQLFDDNNTSMVLADTSIDDIALKASSTFVAAEEPVTLLTEVDDTPDEPIVVTEECVPEEKSEPSVITTAPVVSSNKIELSSIDNLISNIESVLSEYSDSIHKNTVAPAEPIAVVEEQVVEIVHLAPEPTVITAVVEEPVVVVVPTPVVPIEACVSTTSSVTTVIEPLPHIEPVKVPSPEQSIPVVRAVAHDEVTKRRMSIEDLLLAFREDAEAAENAMYYAASSGRLMPAEFRDYIKAFRSPPKTSNINLQIPTSLAMKFVELVVSPHRMTQSSRVKSATKSIASIKKEKNTSVKSKGKQGAAYVRSSIGTMDLNGEMTDVENPFIAKKALQHSPVTAKAMSTLAAVSEVVSEEVTEPVIESVTAVVPEYTSSNVEVQPVIRDAPASKLLTSMMSSSEFAPVITNHKSPRKISISPIIPVQKVEETISEHVTMVVPAVTSATAVTSAEAVSHTAEPVIPSSEPRRLSGTQWSEQELDRVSQAVRRISLDKTVMATLPSGLMEQFQSEIEKLRLEVTEQKGQFVVEREMLMSRLGDVEGKLLAASHKIEEVIEEATRKIEDHERVRLQSDCMLVKNDINRIDEALEAIVQRRRARALLQQQLDDEIASYCFDVPREYTAKSYEEPVQYVAAVQPMTIINPIHSVPMVVTVAKEQEVVEEEYNYLQTGDDFDNYDIDNGLDISITIDAPVAAPVVKPAPVVKAAPVVTREKKTKQPVKSNYISDDEDVIAAVETKRYGNLQFIPLGDITARNKQEKKEKSTSKYMNFAAETDFPEPESTDVIVQMSKNDKKKEKSKKATAAVSDTEGDVVEKVRKSKKTKSTAVSDTEVEVEKVSKAKGSKSKAAVSDAEGDDKTVKAKKTTKKEKSSAIDEVVPEAVAVSSTLTLVPLSTVKTNKKASKVKEQQEDAPVAEEEVAVVSKKASKAVKQLEAPVAEEEVAVVSKKASKAVKEQQVDAPVAEEEVVPVTSKKSSNKAKAKQVDAPVTVEEVAVVNKKASSKAKVKEVEPVVTEEPVVSKKATGKRKKAMTIPQLFIDSMKTEILASNPTESADGVADKLEAMWMQLSASDKSQWTELDIESRNGTKVSNEPVATVVQEEPKQKKSKASSVDSTEPVQKKEKASKKQSKETVVAVEVAPITESVSKKSNKKQSNKVTKKGSETPLVAANDAIIPSLDVLSPVKGNVEMNDISTTDIDADFLMEPVQKAKVPTNKKRAILEPIEEIKENKRPKADMAPVDNKPVIRSNIDTSNTSMNSTSISQIITKSNKFVIPKLKVKK